MLLLGTCMGGKEAVHVIQGGAIAADVVCAPCATNSHP